MPIEFFCSHCQAKLRVADADAGKQTQCPKCSAVLDIPAAADESTGHVVDAALAANPYAAPTGGYAPPSATFNVGPITKTTFDAGAAFSTAWEIFTKHLGECLLATLIYLGVVLAAVALSGAVAVALIAGLGVALDETGAVLGAVVGGAIFFTTLVLVSLGMYYNYVRYFLRIARSESPTYGELVQYFPDMWPFIGANLLFGLMVGVGMMLCIVPGFFLFCMYFPWPYLVLDRKMSVGEAFRLSSQLTDGNKGAILLCYLILVAISFVAGLIPFGLGQLFASPLTALLFLAAYLLMIGQPRGAAASTPLPSNAPAGGNPFAQP